MAAGPIDNFGGTHFDSTYLAYINNNITNINGGPANLTQHNSTHQPVATITNVAQYVNGTSTNAPLDVYQYVFPFNPNALTWEYDLVTASFDTIGGRVIQILSTNIQTMTFDGDAGSRAALLKLYQDMKEVQDYQVETYQPSLLSVPLRDSGTYVFQVWLRSIPKMGWAVDTTTYPYQIQFEVQEDYNSLAVISAASAVSFLDDQLGVGYNPAFSGSTGAGNTQSGGPS